MIIVLFLNIVSIRCLSPMSLFEKSQKSIIRLMSRQGVDVRISQASRPPINSFSEKKRLTKELEVQDETSTSLCRQLRWSLPSKGRSLTVEISQKGNDEVALIKESLQKEGESLVNLIQKLINQMEEKEGVEVIFLLLRELNKIYVSEPKLFDFLKTKNKFSSLYVSLIELHLAISQKKKNLKEASVQNKEFFKKMIENILHLLGSHNYTQPTHFIEAWVIGDFKKAYQLFGKFEEQIKSESLIWISLLNHMRRVSSEGVLLSSFEKRILQLGSVLYKVGIEIKKKGFDSQGNKTQIQFKEVFEHFNQCFFRRSKNMASSFCQMTKEDQQDFINSVSLIRFMKKTIPHPIEIFLKEQAKKYQKVLDSITQEKASQENLFLFKKLFEWGFIEKGQWMNFLLLHMENKETSQKIFHLVYKGEISWITVYEVLDHLDDFEEERILAVALVNLLIVSRQKKLRNALNPYIGGLFKLRNALKMLIKRHMQENLYISVADKMEYNLEEEGEKRNKTITDKGEYNELSCPYIMGFEEEYESEVVSEIGELTRDPLFETKEKKQNWPIFSLQVDYVDPKFKCLELVSAPLRNVDYIDPYYIIAKRELDKQLQTDKQVDLTRVISQYNEEIKRICGEKAGPFILYPTVRSICVEYKGKSCKDALQTTISVNIENIGSESFLKALRLIDDSSRKGLGQIVDISHRITESVMAEIQKEASLSKKSRGLIYSVIFEEVHNMVLDVELMVNKMNRLIIFRFSPEDLIFGVLPDPDLVIIRNWYLNSSGLRFIMNEFKKNLETVQFKEWKQRNMSRKRFNAIFDVAIRERLKDTQRVISGYQGGHFCSSSGYVLKHHILHCSSRVAIGRYQGDYYGAIEIRQYSELRKCIFEPTSLLKRSPSNQLLRNFYGETAEFSPPSYITEILKIDEKIMSILRFKKKSEMRKEVNHLIHIVEEILSKEEPQSFLEEIIDYQILLQYDLDNVVEKMKDINQSKGFDLIKSEYERIQSKLRCRINQNQSLIQYRQIQQSA